MIILGNVTALNGAITNLVTNAIEAGAKKVNIKLEADEKNIVISVKNDGPMIPLNVQRKIFEPFFTTKSNGTGLGLAVVAAVAKVHQGRLQLLSDENETVFSMIIPKYEGTLEPTESMRATDNVA